MPTPQVESRWQPEGLDRSIDESNMMKRTLPLALCLALLAATLGAAGANEAPTVDFSGWFNGVEGMVEAGRLYEQQPQPVFLYFYADWCPYCRQLERELLSSKVVEDYLADILAVRINPEAGPAEAQIAQRYGVAGYPALFVLSGESKTLSPIDRMAMKDGRLQLVSPAAFVDLLKTAGAR